MGMQNAMHYQYPEIDARAQQTDPAGEMIKKFMMMALMSKMGGGAGMLGLLGGGGNGAAPVPGGGGAGSPMVPAMQEVMLRGLGGQ